MKGCVLVAGGAGYIGSHACKALAAGGWQPVVYDNLVHGHDWAVKWGPLVECNLEDRRLVRRALENYHIEAVIHFAANASVAESMESPYKYLHNNATSSLELLEAMREARVRHIVFSSTCATYGVPRRVPIVETEPQAPVNPYGESKLFVERALQWYGRAHGLSWAALRYFNAAGADPEGEIGALLGRKRENLIEDLVGLLHVLRVLVDLGVVAKLPGPLERHARPVLPVVLDLRREHAHRNILLRSDVIASIRRRMIAAGFPGTGTWGENIAADYSDADSVMQVWMASPGHRANILNSAFAGTGVGCAVSASGNVYYCQDFVGYAAGQATIRPEAPTSRKASAAVSTRAISRRFHQGRASWTS